MAYTYELKNDKSGEYINITGYEGDINYLKIPDEIEGIPVGMVNAHAFSDRGDIIEVYIPKTVRILGMFAFHNCISLKKITVSGNVYDYYDGALRGCTSLTEIFVNVSEDENDKALSENIPRFEFIKRLLEDNDRYLTFHIKFNDGVAKLSFPGYVHDAHEDPRARAIHFTIDGSGMAYRQCVGKYKIDFREYDRLFKMACVDSPDIAGDIAFNRLINPYECNEGFLEKYKEFLTENTDVILASQIKRGNTNNIKYMSDKELIKTDNMRAAIELAIENKKNEITSILMEYENKHNDLNEEFFDI